MLIFIKLGGSLITDKDVPNTARVAIIKQLGNEIKNAIAGQPDMNLLIGHGSGSFGHFAAVENSVNSGIQTPQDWVGFQKVWWAARQLNQIVTHTFHSLDLPVVSLPASAALTSKDKEILYWNIEPIQSCLRNRLIPIIFGDVVFDQKLGATILSTEDLFSFLAQKFHPNQLLLAGKEKGVFRNFQNNPQLIKKISPKTFPSISQELSSSTSADVTGGMASKVSSMLKLIEKEIGVSIQIFSAEEPGNLLKALSGQRVGTLLSYE